MSDTLLEGGNVFRDAEKNPLTKRINRADVDPTIKWLEDILGIPLIDSKLGTTGKKPTSGDLDLAIDQDKYTKEEIYEKLKSWAKENHPEDRLRTWVAKSGISVHLRTPINGDDSQGYVQTDLMFGDPDFMMWSSQGEPGAEYRGQHRQILLNSIASAKGYKWQGFGGLTNRETGERTTDVNKIVDILIGPSGKPDDLTSIPKILDAIKDQENYDELVAMAVETFPRFDVKFPQRPGMVTEARKGDPRIQHAEDVVFWEGSEGALRALELLRGLGTDEGREATTIKWDGSPAIIFGRDESGDFVLTDKSGFYAKGYDGKAKSPEELKSMFLDTRMRAKGKEPSAGYEQFANRMAGIFDIYEKAVPQDHRGFFFGDLLYYNTPTVVDGKFKFKPNIVTYTVDQNSEFGEKIAKSTSGVVVHLEVDTEGDKIPFTNRDIFQGEDVYVLPPVSTQKLEVKLDTGAIDKVEAIVKQSSQQIDDLLDSETLRSRRISNFANILYSYLNSKVDTGLTNLGGDFLDWIDSKNFSESKKKNLRDYVSENEKAFKALWQVVDLTMKVKDDIISQLEAQEAPVQAYIGDVEGGEGYVTASPGGSIKLVDRSAFTRANRAVVRESIISRVREILNEKSNLPNNIMKPVVKYFFDVGDKMDLLREVSDIDPTVIKEVSHLVSLKKDIISEVMDEVKPNHGDDLGELEDGTKLTRKIAVVPGAFKPPHRGHLEMVEHYADMVDEVIIMVSPLPRKTPSGVGIGFELSKAIWEIYLRDLGLADRVKVIKSPVNSPVSATYKFVENPDDDPEMAQPGDLVIPGCSTKGGDESRFKANFEKYARDGVGIADPISCAFFASGEALSARDFRAALDAGTGLEKFVPLTTNPEEILSLLGVEAEPEESIEEMILKLVRETMDEASGMAGAAIGGYSVKKLEEDEEEVLEEEEDEVIEEILNYLLGKGAIK